MTLDLNAAWFHLNMASQCLEYGLSGAESHLAVSIHLDKLDFRDSDLEKS